MGYFHGLQALVAEGRVDEHSPSCFQSSGGFPRAEKLQLIQLLIVNLAREEGVPLVEVGTAYPIWSPHQAYDSAAAMLKVLDE